MMRVAAVALVGLLVSACGYVGDPLPPALNIPLAAKDLTAVQRGQDIEISFTAPASTTEELGIREFGAVDLRIGPLPAEFSFERWATEAQGIELPVALPGKSVSVKTPAKPWAGKEVMVAVRFTHPRGRHSEWSNRVLLRPRTPLPKPRLIATPRADGIDLRSEPHVPGAALRIQRDGQPIPETLDKQVAAGKTYAYRGNLVLDGVESELSEPLTVTYVDRFSPDPPQNLTAIPGVGNVALTWDPVPDAASYRIYRATPEGDFTRLAADVATPVFSDKMPLPSARYRITSVDAAANESAPSAEVAVRP